MAAACPGLDSQDLATILEPFRAPSPIYGQTAYLRLEHCDIATIETSETSTMCVETRQMSVLATEEMSAAETGQMSVETGQMSAAETGQMSAVETRQMSSVARTDICRRTTDNVDVSDRRSGFKSAKMFRSGSRMVARS